MSKMKRAMAMVGKIVQVHGDDFEVIEVGTYPGGKPAYVSDEDYLGARLKRCCDGHEVMYRITARLNFTMGNKVKK